jgi:transcription elongation factor SPT6
VDMGNNGKMGYSINSKKFSELDELLQVYVDPLIVNYREIVDSPKFSNRERNAMLLYVAEQASLNRRSSYGISPSDNPLKFYFVYHNVGGHAHYEHLIVKPEGFLFRDKVYSRVIGVINGFKKGEEAKVKERLKKGGGRPREQDRPRASGGERGGERSGSGSRPEERRRK